MSDSSAKEIIDQIKKCPYPDLCYIAQEVTRLAQQKKEQQIKAQKAKLALLSQHQVTSQQLLSMLNQMKK